MYNKTSFNPKGHPKFHSFIFSLSIAILNISYKCYYYPGVILWIVCLYKSGHAFLYIPVYYYFLRVTSGLRTGKSQYFPFHAGAALKQIVAEHFVCLRLADPRAWAIAIKMHVQVFCGKVWSVGLVPSWTRNRNCKRHSKVVDRCSGFACFSFWPN